MNYGNAPWDSASLVPDILRNIGPRELAQPNFEAVKEALKPPADGSATEVFQLASRIVEQQLLLEALTGVRHHVEIPIDPYGSAARNGHIEVVFVPVKEA
jgi:hypothetical protein